MSVRFRRAKAILSSVTSSGLEPRKRGRLLVGDSTRCAWLIRPERRLRRTVERTKVDGECAKSEGMWESCRVVETVEENVEMEKKSERRGARKAYRSVCAAWLTPSPQQRGLATENGSHRGIGACDSVGMKRWKTKAGSFFRLGCDYPQAVYPCRTLTPFEVAWVC